MDFGCVTAGGAVFLPPVIYIAKLLPIFEFLEIQVKTLKKVKKCSILILSMRGRITR